MLIFKQGAFELSLYTRTYAEAEFSFAGIQNRLSIVMWLSHKTNVLCRNDSHFYVKLTFILHLARSKKHLFQSKGTRGTQIGTKTAGFKISWKGTLKTSWRSVWTEKRWKNRELERRVWSNNKNQPVQMNPYFELRFKIYLHKSSCLICF